MTTIMTIDNILKTHFRNLSILPKKGLQACHHMKIP